MWKGEFYAWCQQDLTLLSKAIKLEYPIKNLAQYGKQMVKCDGETWLCW